MFSNSHCRLLNACPLLPKNNKATQFLSQNINSCWFSYLKEVYHLEDGGQGYRGPCGP